MFPQFYLLNVVRDQFIDLEGEGHEDPYSYKDVN